LFRGFYHEKIRGTRQKFVHKIFSFSLECAIMIITIGFYTNFTEKRNVYV